MRKEQAFFAGMRCGWRGLSGNPLPPELDECRAAWNAGWEVTFELPVARSDPPKVGAVPPWKDYREEKRKKS